MTETKKSEKERFIERFEKARKGSLKDIKFMVSPDMRLTEEEFFASANSFADAREKRDFEVMESLECPEPEESDFLM